ncbi:enoyl-CoA hydratase-related protein [Dehalococcoidia bacterium]|nr:enoyl-CoA hydratase-related protein [Dehalococcoidia bacterium]
MTEGKETAEEKFRAKLEKYGYDWERHRRHFRGRPVEEFDFREIIYEKDYDKWVARITLNRPKRYNAYTGTELVEICEALHDALVDDGVAVLVITGAGDRAFCTGGDAATYSVIYPERPHEFYYWWEYYERMLYLIRTLGKPVIARLNGVVAGGGNEINLACDISIAAEHARFIQPGTRVGSVSAGGASQWLPLTIGDKRTRWMLMIGDEIDAKTALEWGLVNVVVPYDQLDEAVDNARQKLVEKFPDCLRYTKVQCNFWGDLAWTTMQHARDWLSVHYATGEPIEGFNAFLEKRKVDFAGMREMSKRGLSHSYYPYGAPLKTCPQCGAKYLPQAFEFCGKCGAKLEG